MKHRNNKILAVVSGGILILGVLFVSLLGPHSSSQSSITVHTDLPPLRLALNDSVYNIGSIGRVIDLPAGIYHYRASAVVEGQRITLTDTLTLAQNKNEQLDLNYLLYNKQSIATALCATSNATADCLFKAQNLQVTYCENYQWAAVAFDTDVGKGKAVLQVKSGGWQVVAGPGSDIPTTGYYPQSVEEALHNEE